MATEERYLPVLQRWQRNKFRPFEVNLIDAAKAARERRNEVVHPVQQGGKWLYVHKDSGQPAIFTFAVQWSSNDNLLTGNFVPEGEKVPDDVSQFDMVDEKHLSRASVTYSFDTSIDNSIFGHIKALEDRVMDSKAFNTGQRPRVKWQNGDDPGDQYRVPYRFFNVCNSRNYRPPSEKEKKGFHSWVINAVTKPGQTRAMINAPMPSYLSYKEGQPLRSIFKCNPPSFNEGDIVVMTFRFGVFIGRKNWKPDIMPEEFIRVAKAEELQDGLSSSSFRWQVDDRNFDRLEANAIVAPIVTQDNMEMGQDPPEESNSDADDTLSQLSAASILRRATIRMSTDEATDAMDVVDEGIMVEHDETDRKLHDGEGELHDGGKKVDKIEKKKKGRKQ